MFLMVERATKNEPDRSDPPDASSRWVRVVNHVISIDARPRDYRMQDAGQAAGNPTLPDRYEVVTGGHAKHRQAAAAARHGGRRIRPAEAAQFCAEEFEPVW
jgi:hypothetical protein